jgi:ankyrin repeat protein
LARDAGYPVRVISERGAGGDNAAYSSRRAIMNDLMQAVRAGDAEAVRDMLARGAGVNETDEVNAVDEDGFTPLHRAVYDAELDRGHPRIVRLLIDAGANLDARIFFGITPLMLAAGGGQADAVEMLINAGADVLAANEGGRSANAMAKDKFYVDVINLLTDAERQLGVTEEGTCSSSRAPVKASVVNMLKPKTH